MEKVQYKNRILNVYNCGASLIHRRVVLTSKKSIICGSFKYFQILNYWFNSTIQGASCAIAIPLEKLNIRAGEWDSSARIEPFPHSDYDVEEVVLHPDFNKNSLKNDIALLFLKTEVEKQPHIGTVCLPAQDLQFNESNCFASGWGKKSFGINGTYPPILKKVELPIVPYEACQNNLRETRLGKHFILDKSFICAGGEDGIGEFII